MADGSNNNCAHQKFVLVITWFKVHFDVNQRKKIFRRHQKNCANPFGIFQKFISAYCTKLQEKSFLLIVYNEDKETSPQVKKGKILKDMRYL